ncbi:hypothetical protein, partial [Klebsiella aerogenes]|uniref:hypothetical protein n=1 Tax=Klebsiella aerogenes TaxID=548 RepID=UPI00195447D1
SVPSSIALAMGSDGVGILGGIITVSGTVLIIPSLSEGGLAGIIGIVFGVPVVGAGGLLE